MLSLITPYARFDWRRACTGAAVWAAFAALCSVVEALLYPGRYRLTFNPQVFFAYAALALLLTPLQTATEELIFRGYLMQGLGRLLQRPWPLIVISAALFTLPHAANPEVALAPLLVLPQYFIIGALLAAVTLKDGRLELAIGIHAANNLFTGLVANIEPSVISTVAIFTSEFDPAYALVAVTAASVATYCVLFRATRRPFFGGRTRAVRQRRLRRGAPACRCHQPAQSCWRRRSAISTPPRRRSSTRPTPAIRARRPRVDAPGGRTVRRLLQAYARSADFARWQISPRLARTAAPVARAARRNVAGAPQLRDDQEPEPQQRHALAPGHPLLVVPATGAGLGVDGVGARASG